MCYFMVRNFSDQELNTLFRTHLTQVTLPEEVHARVQHQMLSEVIFTLQAERLNTAVKSHANHEILPAFLSAPKLATAGIGVSIGVSIGLCIILLTLIYIFQFLRPLPPAVSASMTEAGTAFVVPEHQRPIVPILPDNPTSFAAGDSIVVHSGRVQIEHANQWRITLSAGTTAELQEFESSAEFTQAVLTVHSGEALTEILKPQGAQDLIKFHSPSAHTIAKDAAFIVRADSETSTYFAVLSGEIEVEMAGQSITVRSGEELQATAGAALLVLKQKNPSEAGYAFDSKPESTPTIEVPALLENTVNAGIPSTDTAKAKPPMHALGVTASGNWYLVCCSPKKQLSWITAEQLDLGAGKDLPILPDESTFVDRHADASRAFDTTKTSISPPTPPPTSTPMLSNTPTPSATSANKASATPPLPTPTQPAATTNIMPSHATPSTLPPAPTDTPSQTGGANNYNGDNGDGDNGDGDNGDGDNGDGNNA